MRTRLAAHLTYANAIATIAVFVAMGGTSYAAARLGRDSVKGPNIAKNAVTSSKIAKNAVTSDKVKDGALLARDFKRGQLPAGATGPTGPTGPTGDAGGTGVRASAQGTNGVGLRANATGANGKAAVFTGDVQVIGTLSKSAGTFKIDHPLDPANKYLSHSFVESPDMKNLYDGVVVTDGSGFATVTMPDWFDALNGHLRYQLTVVGHSFARAIVWKELANRTFTIRTDEPRTKVSWQVTGVRQDAYAKAHRTPVEQDKTGTDRGRYLTPELFGQPASKAIGAG
ncbi:MAG: hypothetical protein JWQ48_2400 [Conexibacter sp.]|nr:hypothetical protein [Conexibacter sp.]